jgi:fumarylacetoacetase
MLELEANNSELTSWVDVPADSDFPIQNLPFGIFSGENGKRRVGVAIGDDVLDLRALHVLGYLDNVPFRIEDFETASLNRLMAMGKRATRELRTRLSRLLRSDNPELRNKAHHRGQVLLPREEVRMHIPVEVGDYTDFYSSEDHARNVGKMFRDPDNALLPNWKHMPVGYHGRASSIVVSGTEVRRPKGQLKPADGPPVFGPSRLLDFELEMAFVTYPGKPMGEEISTGEADDFIFGMLLLNDWSARDIQKWEYVPLGPFLGKNFASSVSPWVVTLDALEPHRVPGPVQDPAVLPYLAYKGNAHYDVDLRVEIETAAGDRKEVCHSNLKHMYWNMKQQLAHHTVGGCNVRCGDMMASGTISGPEVGSFGSMLEISWRGTKPVDMPDGTQRKFIQDGDTVRMRGWTTGGNSVRIGFGEVSGKLFS